MIGQIDTGSSRIQPTLETARFFSFVWGSDKGREPYTTYTDHKEDPNYHSEFFGDDIRHKIALISWLLVHLSGAFWPADAHPAQSLRLVAPSLRMKWSKTHYTSGM
jgi:hypothetical protein